MTNKDVIIARLLRQNEQQADQIRLLIEENKNLRERIARLEKNSSNSSKPPSSDIVNPKAPSKNGRKRKRGGQPGHKKYTRQPFTDEQIDNTIIHELSAEKVGCRNLTPLDKTESVLHRVDLPEKLYTVVDHRFRLYKTPNGIIVKTKLPYGITPRVGSSNGRAFKAYFGIRF